MRSVSGNVSATMLRVSPLREAGVHHDKRLTYGDLETAMTRWAKALLAAGVGHGDRIAMLTPPSSEWLTVMLATTEIGAIWCGYHPPLQEAGIQACHGTG